MKNLFLFFALAFGIVSMNSCSKNDNITGELNFPTQFKYDSVLHANGKIDTIKYSEIYTITPDHHSLNIVRLYPDTTVSNFYTISHFPEISDSSLVLSYQGGQDFIFGNFVSTIDSTLLLRYNSDILFFKIMQF